MLAPYGKKEPEKSFQGLVKILARRKKIIASIPHHVIFYMEYVN